MIRRLGIAAVAAVAVASALPAQAAPKAQLYYLGNTGAPANNACTQVLGLLKTPTPNAECTGNTLAVQGNGFLGDATYNTGKGTNLRLDASRPVTGSIYVVSLPLVSGGAADSLPYLPGYAKGTFTVKIGSTTLGTFAVDGVIPPVTGLKKDFSFKIPSSLNNKFATKVTVSVDWTDVVGLVDISYTAPTASTITVPTR